MVEMPATVNICQDKSKVLWSVGGGMPQNMPIDNIRAFINIIKEMNKIFTIK